MYLGLGGGFNERGIVEYKEYHSDDEFDDFGRRKKKVIRRTNIIFTIKKPKSLRMNDFKNVCETIIA